MRERRVRVIPVKRSEPDVDQFVLALLTMVADRQSNELGAPDPREAQLDAESDVEAETGDDAA